MRKEANITRNNTQKETKKTVKKVARKTIELDTEKEFTIQARDKGLIIFKGNASELKGIPDRILFGKNGKTAFVELKKHGGVFSDNQKYWEEKIGEFGHKYFIVYDERDFLQVWDFFENLDA